LALLLASFSLSGCAKHSSEVRPITPPTPQTQSVQVDFKRFDFSSGDIVDYTRVGDLTERIVSFSAHTPNVSKDANGYTITYGNYSKSAGKWIVYTNSDCRSEVSFKLGATKKGDNLNVSFPKDYYYWSKNRMHLILVVIVSTGCPPLSGSFSTLEADAKKIFAGIGKLNFKEYPTPEVKSVQPVSQTLKTGYNAFPKFDPICKNSVSFPSPDTWDFVDAIKSFSARKDLRVIERGNYYRLLYGHAAFDIKRSLTSANDLRFELQKTYNYEPSDDKPAVLEADAKNIVSKLNALPLKKQSIELSCALQSEAMETKYRQEAILKGFERVLNRYEDSLTAREYAYQQALGYVPGKYTNVYVLPIADQVAKLVVVVKDYLTQSGAKAHYFIGDIKYSLESDGNVKGVTATDIQKAHNLIKAIIKDPDVALR
jgi:hypothetical protein